MSKLLRESVIEEMENNIVTEREEENENWESQHNIMEETEDKGFDEFEDEEDSV